MGSNPLWSQWCVLPVEPSKASAQQKRDQRAIAVLLHFSSLVPLFGWERGRVCWSTYRNLLRGITGWFPDTFNDVWSAIPTLPSNHRQHQSTSHVPTKVCHGMFLLMMLATAALFFGVQERTIACFDSGRYMGVELRMYIWGGWSDWWCSVPKSRWVCLKRRKLEWSPSCAFVRSSFFFAVVRACCWGNLAL